MVSARGALAAVAGLIVVSVCAQAARADEANYPTRRIRWVVAYPAGSTVDVVARKFANVFARKIGESIYIDNVPGASGIIGAAEVAKAAPDGYTFLLTLADPLIASAILNPSPSYESLRNFTYIAKFWASYPYLIVNPSNPAKTLGEFLGAAKSARVTYGSFGQGSFPQIMMEQLALDAGVTFAEVPYRGPPQAVQDLIANEISSTLVSAVNARIAMPYGSRLIAVSGKDRSKVFPDVPSFGESGFNSVSLQTPVWEGLVGPAGLPARVVDRNIAAIREAINDPEMAQLAAELGSQLIIKPPKEFDAEFRAEYAAVSKLLSEKAAGAR